MHARAVQTHLPNGVWIPLGINSVYTNDDSTDSWETLSAPVITDVADDKFTYAVSNENTYGYNILTGLASTIDITNNQTTFSGATIGLFAIINKRAGGFTLNGSATYAVHLKLINSRPKRDIPVYTMYIKGLTEPAVKIEYQADYEGEFFRIKYGPDTPNNPYDFYGYFNHENTYDNPAVLREGAISISEPMLSADIFDMIDFNITDNNVTQMRANTFRITNSLQGLMTGDELVIYKLEDGFWKSYHSENRQANDFTRLNVGEGYWIKATSANANNDGNITKMGLITNDVGAITQDVYENMEDGWSLATFSDDYRFRLAAGGFRDYKMSLASSPTAMFIPASVLQNEGVNLFLKPFGDNDVSILDQNLTLQITTTGRYQNTTDVAQGINIAVEARNRFYNEGIQMRSYPAMNRANDAGVIVVAHHIFEVNSSNAEIVSLTGETLAQTTTNTYATTYGDHFLSAQTISTSSDINQSIQFKSQVSENPATVTDLNVSNAQKLGLIYNGLQEATQNRNGSSLFNADVFYIEVDFNSSANYNDASLFHSFIFGSDESIGMRDSTYVKIYQFVGGGEFVVKGNTEVRVTTAANATLTDIIDAINTTTARTNVTAKLLNTVSGEFFTILYQNYSTAGDVTSSDFDLLEDSINLFTLLPSATSLSSVVLPDRNVSLGALGAFYSHLGLLESTLNFDEVVLHEGANNLADYGNIYELSVNGGFDDNGSIGSIAFYKNPTYVGFAFPPTRITQGATEFLNLFTDVEKRLTSILSQEISANGSIYWAITDTTIEPSGWLGNVEIDDGFDNDNDVQKVLQIQENKAYWVRTEPLSSERRSLLRSYERFPSKQKIDRRVSYEFNNSISSDGTLQTINHIAHKISVEFEDKSFGDFLGENYNIVANIKYEGEHAFEFRKGVFEFTVDADTMELVEDSDNIIHLRSSDEFGDNFIDPNSFAKINFTQPLAPKLSWYQGELIVDSIFDASTLEVYHNYLSEILIKRQESRLDYPQLHENKRLLWNEYGDTVEKGALRKLAAIINDKQVYSHAKVLLYAPLKSGYAMGVSKDASNKRNLTPYSYEDDTFIDNRDDMQLELFIANAQTQSVKMAYSPIAITNEPIAGLPRIVYIKEKGAINTLASINYNARYAGELFYFEYKNILYQGRFPTISGINYFLDPSITVNIFNYEADYSLATNLVRVDNRTSIENAQDIYIKGFNE